LSLCHPLLDLHHNSQLKSHEIVYLQQVRLLWLGSKTHIKYCLEHVTIEFIVLAYTSCYSNIFSKKVHN